MEKNSIFTSYHRKLLAVSLLAGVLILLAGCSGDFSPIDESTTGFFNQKIVYPFSLLIKWLASKLSGSYGLSIIVITIALRLVILPFMVRQQVQGQENQVKMKVIRPEMEKIQEKYRDKKDMEDQSKMQREMAELYKKHDFNPASMVLGCLPLIIQMPFLIGFYYAIRRTPEIGEQTFLWFNLGETNYMLAIVAMAVYYVQARVSLIGMDEQAQGPMRAMVYISPIMIGFISFVTPAALPLYWAVGGLFMIVQTIFIKKVILKQ